MVVACVCQEGSDEDRPEVTEKLSQCGYSDADPPGRLLSAFPLSWLNEFTGTTDPRTHGAITNFLQNLL